MGMANVYKPEPHDEGIYYYSGIGSEQRCSKLDAPNVQYLFERPEIDILIARIDYVRDMLIARKAEIELLGNPTR